jgi:hypothetical protein
MFEDIRAPVHQWGWSFDDLTTNLCATVGCEYKPKTIQGWVKNWSSYNSSTLVARYSMIHSKVNNFRALETLLTEIEKNPSVIPPTPSKKKESRSADSQINQVESILVKEESRCHSSYSHHKCPYSSKEESKMEDYRVDSSKVEFGTISAHGGYGTIYRGTYFGSEVAIKQVHEKEKALKERKLMR